MLEKLKKLREKMLVRILIVIFAPIWGPIAVILAIVVFVVGFLLISLIGFIHASYNYITNGKFESEYLDSI